MDRKFLSTMASSFYCDFNLQKHNNIWQTNEECITELNQYLLNIVTELKLTNVNMYLETFKLSKYKQYVLIYSLLEDYVNENYDGVLITESDLSIDELQLINEAGEIIALSIASITGGALLYKWVRAHLTGPTKKLITNTMTSLFKIVDDFHKFVESKDRVNKVATKLFYNNYQTCNKQCNIGSNPGQNELSGRIEYTLRHDSHAEIDKLAASQFVCLFKCFVEFNINVGSNIFNQLQQCMSGSGVSINKSIELVLNKPEQLTAQCSVYYDFLLKHFKDYKDLISAIDVFTESEKQLLITAYFKGHDALRSLPMFK